MKKAIIFDIQRNSFIDGPGIRTTVFFKGCNLKCRWCHNPESQVCRPQLMYYREKCTGCGRCAEVCPTGTKECIGCGKCVSVCLAGARRVCGREMTPNEVFDEIVKDKPYYDTSGGGVTFSGGECMLQPEFVSELAEMCRNSGISVAADTAGNIPWQYFEQVLPFVDLFLYDLKCSSEKLHIEATGVSNKLILENLTRLSEKSDVLIRIPVIPGFNDNSELSAMAELLKNVKHKAVELLPYHAMGKNKYAALNMNFTDYAVPDASAMKSYRSLFQA